MKKLITILILLSASLILAPNAKADSICDSRSFAGGCEDSCFDTSCGPNPPVHNSCGSNDPAYSGPIGSGHSPCDDPQRSCQANNSCGNQNFGCNTIALCQSDPNNCPFCNAQASGPCYQNGNYLGQGSGACDTGSGNCFTNCANPVCSQSNPFSTCINGACTQVNACGTTDCSACTGPPPPPGCFQGVCGSYTDFNCPVGQSRICQFASHSASCSDGGSFNYGDGCTGTCGACAGSPLPPPPGGPPPSGSCTENDFCSNGQCRHRNCPGGDSVLTVDSACNAGAGCAGNNTCTLGSGAGGCNDGSGRCCQAGLSCKNGVCTPEPPQKTCAPLGPITGSPANGTIGLPPNVTLTWGTNDGPTGACTGSGRSYTLETGTCLTNIYDPTTCTPTPAANTCSNCSAPDGSAQRGPGCACDIGAGQCNGTVCGIPNGAPSNTPNTCGGGPSCTGGYSVYHGTSAGGSFYCGGRPFAATPFTKDLTGLTSGWHYWMFTITCNCHECEGGAPPANSGPWMFQVAGGTSGTGPAAPILVCQLPTAGNSGDPHDICDASVSPPLNPVGTSFGYGNANRYNLNARDGGPAGARQAFYSHTYHILDLMAPLGINNPKVVTGPNNGAGSLFTLDGRATIPLTNGHRYNWYVDTTDFALPPNPLPNSAPSASWDFLYDTSNPNGGITGINNGACYDPTTLPASMTVTANDPIPTGGEASGLRQTQLNVNGVPRNVTTTCIPAPGLPGTWNCPTSFVTNPPSASGDFYNLFINTNDNAGNIGISPTTRFVYKTECIGPWLQTTNGDVHSNDRVNTPGGPN